MNQINTKYYWQELGFENDPFQLNSNNEIFKIEEWNNYYDLLKHLSNHSRTIKLIIGEKGVGKTTFIKMFTQKFEKEYNFFHVVANPTWEIGDYITKIASHLKLTIDLAKHAQAQQTITEYINHDNVKHIFLIDNAHNLSDDCLIFFKHWVSILSVENPKIHFFLIGDFILEDNFKNLLSDEYKQFTRTFKLTPLDFNKTKSYLEHLLLLAGYKGKFIFTAKNIKNIHEVSGGIFSKIHQIARTILMEKLMETNNFYSLITRYKKILILVAIVLGVLSLFLLNSNKATNVPKEEKVVTDLINEDNNGQVTEINLEDSLRSQNNNVTLSKQEDRDLKDGEATEHESVKSTDEVSSLNTNEPSQAPQSTAETSVAENTPSGHNDNVVSEVKEGNAADAVQDKEISMKEEPKKAPYSNFVDNNTNANSVKDVSTNIDEAPISESKSNTDEAVISKEQSHHTKSKALIHKKATNAKKAKEINYSPNKSEQQILNKKSTSFTIQLAAVQTEIAAKKYIANNHLKQAYYFKNQVTGKIIFAIISGEYKTKNEAKKMLTKLVTQTKNSKCWIRKYSEIQSIIKKNKH